MKTTYTMTQRFEIDFCYQDEGGSEVIAFDVYHRWNLPECRPGVLCGYDHLIKVESNRCRGFDDGDFSMIGFPVKQHRFGTRLRLGRGRRAYDFAVRRIAPGGNIYWETILFPAARVPHVLNWLRRQPNFSKTEWTTDFEPVWHSRRALDVAALKTYGIGSIKRELKRQAADCGCTVGRLIELSKYPSGKA